MLAGYVSDERYVALSDVALLFENETTVADVRSSANGAVFADIPPGTYTVSLNKAGYGPKRVELTLTTGEPHQFRLLSDGLLGYAWPKWVRAGERSEFRIHSSEPYKISLWRYGYRKELVQKIGWFDEHGPGATVQITPDGDYTQSGVQWNKFGYTSPRHKQYVSAPSRSGLYCFHACTDAGRFFTFPWIVAPAEPRARIAVLAANITWNAYNNFGGRSNYIHPDRLPATPTLNARLELRRYTDPDNIDYDTHDYAPLSFDRPEPINHIPEQDVATDPVEGRAACHIAPAEWRFLAWMEREGLDYDLYAETQFHDGVLDLDDYRLLIITTHPEYWSSDMYFRLKRWVFERGGRLMYLGGNGLNCEVELVGDNCIYHNERTRDLRASNGKLESRFHQRHESEANLLGVVFDDRGIMTAAPYRTLDAAHWVFAGTGLADGDLFGVHSQHERVPGGASGHETDKRSASSPANTQLLAKGTNAGGEGGAEMVMHQPEGGGAVFAVGSINWPTSLLVDAGVSRITANVARRFVSTDDLSS